MGKSGSGKSVMIKCVIGLEQPDSGSILVDESRKSINSNKKIWTNYAPKSGFLFQGNVLYDSMSVRENLEFRYAVIMKKFMLLDTTPLVMEALESVGLAHTIDLMPNELSGGMKRRIALARTLILKPKIILYDEPTTVLDPITSKEIVLLMNSIQNNTTLHRLSLRMM